MPTLSSIAIPVISRSESAGFSSIRSSSPLHIKSRTYSEDPLPIQADADAPRNARIVNRTFDAGVASFEIKIGETSISDIGLDEILEYVSAYELEEYENRAFEQERELLKIAEKEEERYRLARLERQREKARLRGVAGLRERSDVDDNEDVATGKHGRARPSYKKSFKEMKVRRRRKRDPSTGELMPLSDEEEATALQLESSEDERPPARSATQSERPHATKPIELPTRRRRKRDPATGELLPLDPVSAEDGVERQKRPRRRRHPITNELMPLGWRYDPNEDGRIGSSTDGSALPRSIPSMNRLSLDHEQESKRRRLDHSTDRAPRSRSPVVAIPSSLARPKSKTTRPKIKDALVLAAFKNGNSIIDLVGSDSDSDADAIAVARQPPEEKPKLLRRSVSSAAVAQATKTHKATVSSQNSRHAGVPPAARDQWSFPIVKPPSSMRESSASESPQPETVGEPRQHSDSSSRIHFPFSPEPPTTKFPAKYRSQGDAATSIMHPSAEPLSHNASSSDEAMDDGEQQMDEDEFLIERILGHHVSDPRTHPVELGKQPVMLYQVKWVGWQEPTWEPLTSFPDLEVVRIYQRRVGMEVEGD